MSEVESPVETKAESASNGSATRLLILLGCLALAVGALGYDRYGARPASKAKSEELQDLADERAGSTDRQLTSEEVQEALGKSPAKTLDGDEYVIEVYKWRAGLPWRSYDLNVVYRKMRESQEEVAEGKVAVVPRFHTMYYLEEPERHLMPGYKPPPLPEGSLDLPPDPVAVGAPSRGGGGNGRPEPDDSTPPGESGEAGESTTTPPAEAGEATTTPPAEAGESTTTPPAEAGESTTTPPGVAGESTTTPPGEAGAKAPAGETPEAGDQDTNPNQD